MDARYEGQARHAVEGAVERGPIKASQEETTKRAQEAVSFARIMRSKGKPLLTCARLQSMRCVASWG
jgi:hypothetical protein